MQWMPEDSAGIMLDGHGEYGAVAVARAIEFFKNHPCDARDIAALERYFALLHAHLLDQEANPEGGGTTATIARVTQRSSVYDIISGNVGDSHAVLIGPKSSRLLTTDHSATNFDEVQRLENEDVETLYSGSYFDATPSVSSRLSRMVGDRRFRDDATDYHEQNSEELFLSVPDTSRVKTQGNAVLAMFADGVFRYDPDIEIDHHPVVRRARELMVVHQTITRQNMGELARKLVEDFASDDNSSALIIGLPKKRSVTVN